MSTSIRVPNKRDGLQDREASAANPIHLRRVLRYGSYTLLKEDCYDLQMLVLIRERSFNSGEITCFPEARGREEVEKGLSDSYGLYVLLHF